MYSTFAPRLPFEMFDGIGHIDLRTIDPDLGKSLFHQTPRRSNERMPAQVFLVSGHLADEHNSRRNISFAENRLRGVYVNVAALAFRSRTNQ